MRLDPGRTRVYAPPLARICIIILIDGLERLVEGPEDILDPIAQFRTEGLELLLGNEISRSEGTQLSHR